MSEGLAATLPRPPTAPHTNGAVKEPLSPPLTLPKEPLAPSPAMEKPTVPITEADNLKMDRFNFGEGGRDVAVPFQLKAGEQGYTFALQIDPANPNRMINLPDVRQIESMSPYQKHNTAIIKQNGDKLAITFQGKITEVSREELLRNPHKTALSRSVGFEVRDFDPQTHGIVIHRVKPEPLVVPPVSPVVEPAPAPKPTQKSPFQRLVDVVPPFAAGLSTAGMPQDVPPAIIEEMPGGFPSGQPLENFLAPKPVVETQTSQPEPEILDESLKCPATREFTIKAGQSLTRALVEVNGLGRYLNEEGKLDVPALYRDLACLLVQPENFSQLEKSDPKVAAFIQSVTGGEVPNLIGPLSADLIYGGLRVLNENDPGRTRYHDQLVIIQPGQTFHVPDFSANS